MTISAIDAIILTVIGSVSTAAVARVMSDAFPALFKLADAMNPTGLGRTFEQMIQEKRLPNPTLP